MTTQERYEAEVAEARSLGRNHGYADASWLFDGNTPEETYRWFRKGIDEGDPEVMDSLPHGSLSGEWADAPTPQWLYAELGIDPEILDGFLTDPFCDAYEAGYDDAVMESVETTLEIQLGGAA